MGKKILKIALFLIISLVAYCLLSGGFGYLYYRTQSVSYDVSLSETGVPEWLNYSLVALLPQSVRGITAAGMQGRIFLTVELTVRILMLAIFIGLFVTYISRHSDSMFPTRYIYRSTWCHCRGTGYYPIDPLSGLSTKAYEAHT